MEVSGAANDAQGCSDGEECRIGGIAIEGDSLTILFVLLRPPADANESDVCGERVRDVGHQDFSILVEGEIVRNEGFRQ